MTPATSPPTSPPVNSQCRSWWADCLPSAFNAVGLASSDPDKGKGPHRGFPVESNLPSKKQKTADDWSGSWAGSWADSDDEDEDDEAGCSDRPSMRSDVSQDVSLDADSLADLLSLPAPVNPLFPTLDLSLRGADAPSEAPDRALVRPVVGIVIEEWRDDETNSDTEDTDEEYWDGCIDIVLPPRRRLVSVFAVSDRWGLSPEDAAEIMHNFESAQGGEMDV